VEEFVLEVSIRISGVRIPSVRIPCIRIPGVRIPGVIIPGVIIPSVRIPGVRIPGVIIPGVIIPVVRIPGAELTVGVCLRSNAEAEEETLQIVMAEDAEDEMVPPPRGGEFTGVRNSSGPSSEERRVMRDEMLNQMHLERTKQFLDAGQDVIEEYGGRGLNLLQSAIDGTNDKPLNSLLNDKESMKAFVISMMRSITANSDEARNDNHRLREDISALEEKIDHVIKSKLANLIPSCRRRS
jgi:hypothetical protein